jgi:hypothetical protein
MSETQKTQEMPTARLSDYKRVQMSSPGQITIQARAEIGRGKRFGTAGELSLSNDEAIQLAKFVINNYIESENTTVTQTQG